MTNNLFLTDHITYTKRQKYVINYIYKHIDTIPFMTINDLAKASGTSVATISRLVRIAGYDSFKDLKTSIVTTKTVASPAEKISKAMKNSEQSDFSKSLLYHAFQIEKTLEMIDQQAMHEAINHILTAKTIYFHAKGAAHSLAELFAFRLNRIGLTTNLLASGGSEIFEQLTQVTDKDLLILFSFQKASQEAKVLLEHTRNISCPTVLFTSQLYDSSSNRADINLYVYRGEETEYHSMTAPVAIIDTLTVLVAKSAGDQAIEYLDRLYHLKQNYIDHIPL